MFERLRWTRKVSGCPFATRFFAMPWPIRPMPMNPMPLLHADAPCVEGSMPACYAVAAHADDRARSQRLIRRA